MISGVAIGIGKIGPRLGETFGDFKSAKQRLSTGENIGETLGLAMLTSVFLYWPSFTSRKPTNWCGSVIRYVTHPGATAVYNNTCCHLFRQKQRPQTVGLGEETQCAENVNADEYVLPQN